MIRELRKKFIRTAMAAVVVVMLLIVAALNVVSYVNMKQETSRVMELLKANEGEFPDDWDDFYDGDNPGMNPGMNPAGHPEGPGREWGDLSPETPFQTRFFSVWFDDDGSVETKLNRIAAINYEEAVAMAEELKNKGRASGYVKDYQFEAVYDDDKVGYIFVDRRIELNSFRTFLRNSLIVAAAAIIGVYFLIVLFSKKTLKPVEESYSKQKQFITNAGHELKTPLAVIRSCADVLEMETGENKWIGGIRDQVTRLSGLTNDLVALSRMDEENYSAKKTETNLSEMAKEVYGPFVLSAEAKNLSAELEIEPDIRKEVNPDAIRQLMSILGDNAVKYTSAYGTIHLGLKRRGHRVMIYSENPADGFTPGDQDILFDRFYRKDGSRSSETGGYGIGLSMARSIAESHGGSIKASSDGKNLRIEAII